MVVFTDTPQTLGADDLINYSSKQGSYIYKQGIAPLDDKALTDGFNMTANQTVVFTEAFLNHATAMGWNMGSKQITTFTNSVGVAVNIIKSYGQIDEATLKTACERFCKAGQADADSRPKQNNTMMSMCLNKLLTATAKVSLLTYRAEYTFDGVEYAPLMYKIIMRLATIGSVATTQTLRDNLQNLGVFTERMMARAGMNVLSVSCVQGRTIGHRARNCHSPIVPHPNSARQPAELRSVYRTNDGSRRHACIIC
jgi:hypothetical protein